MGDTAAWWARTFEPEGTFGFSGYGGESERRAETIANEPGGANVLKAEQAKQLKAAEDKVASEEATTASAIAKARQKALAAATVSSGRSGTIKTSSQGVIGQASGTTKELIGQ